MPRLYRVRLSNPFVMFPDVFWVMAKDGEEAMDKVRLRMQTFFPNVTIDGYSVLMAHEEEVIV